MLRGPGRKVIAVTTAYPRVRPDVWVGMDYSWCYDRALLWEAFPKIARAGMKDHPAEGRPWHSYPDMYFADVREGSLSDVFTRRSHDDPFLWCKDTLTVAVHYAVWSGCSRIALVGCDCGGGSDYYDDRTLTGPQRAYNRRLYAQQADRLRSLADIGEKHGVEIVSCTPNSPINSGMAFLDLPEVLRLAEARVRHAEVHHATERPSPSSTSKPVLLHLTSHMQIGGAEFYILNMVKALPEFDHRVVAQQQPNARMVRHFAETGGIEIATGESRKAEVVVAQHEPEIVVVHNWKEEAPNCPNQPVIKVHHGPHLRFASGCTNVSVSQRAIHALQLNPGDWTVIPGGVDTMAFPPRSGKPVLGHFTSDRAHKYSPDTMRIFWAALDAGADVLCVGGRTGFASMGDSIATPPASIIRKPDYLRRMHMAVYHTRNDCVEGSSLCIAEMMMAGIAVVADARGGNLDQIKHGETGFLVEWGDIKEFCRIATELIANPDRCRKIGQAAAEYAAVNFGLDVFGNRWRGAIRPLLHRPEAATVGRAATLSPTAVWKGGLPAIASVSV
jgi:hypothetical protein